MNTHRFRKAKTIFWIITILAFTYIWFYLSNQYPSIPSSIKSEVKERIDKEGHAYLDILSVHTTENLLDTSEDYRVTKIGSSSNLVIVAFRHKEIKDVPALLTFGYYGSSVEAIAEGLIRTGLKPN